MTQGIIQGEQLDDIMLRIANDSGERSINAMLRNARTAYTWAQNAGRMQGMKQAEAKGVRVQKEWSAFMDSLVRDAHAELNGQRVDIDEPFDSMLGPIMGPADPSADPANVYNCRCTLKQYFPDYPDASGERGATEDNEANREAYARWKFQKNVGKDTKDVSRWLKTREKARSMSEKAEKAAAKAGKASQKASKPTKTQTSAEDILANATYVNGPKSDLKPGEKYRQVTGVSPTNLSIESADITQSYIHSAKTKEGKIVYNEGYKQSGHANEIETARWLSDNLGMDVEMVPESFGWNEKSYDLKMDGKPAEVKNISTEKAADSAVRKALKQLGENDGNIIINLDDSEIKPEEVIKNVDRRIYRSAKRILRFLSETRKGTS